MQHWRFGAALRGCKGGLGPGAIVLAVLLQAGAVPMAGAQEPVLLTVTDLAGISHSFDRAALEALPHQSFTTSTIWTDGQTTFSGPPLRAVLAKAGITGGKVELIALNDYIAELDLADATDTTPIIATRQDGQPFDVRDSGPLWIIYPYDSSPAFQTEPVYAASVWQLVALRALAP